MCAAKSVNPLVERAVTGLLRICQRLLPYKEDTAETLLRSLKLVIGLSPNVVWELAETIAIEVGGRWGMPPSLLPCCNTE